MLNRVREFGIAFLAGRQAEDGQGLAEYGLILALVAALCLGALATLGTSIAESVGFTALPQAL
jgi:pilus assembly protein Flp/PilA